MIKITESLYIYSDINYINMIYKQSYCRIGPYCIGILMAHFYLKNKGSLSIPSVRLIIDLFLYD